MNADSLNLIATSTGQQVTSAVECSTMVSDSAVAKTDTVMVVPSECSTVETDTLVNAQWVCTCIIFIIVFVIAYTYYRQIKSLKDHILRLNELSIKQNKFITSQNLVVDSLRQRIDKLELNAAKSVTPTSSKTKRDESRPVCVSRKNPSVISPIESEPKVQPQNTIVKYATLQAPDSNGTLRFAERSMINEATDQKMFEVVLDTLSGTGTYRVNLRAMSILMSDLQQLRDFVEPFTTNGYTSAQHIVNEKPGKIHQDGKFWIVDELAKIKIV